MSGFLSSLLTLFAFQPILLLNAEEAVWSERTYNLSLLCAYHNLSFLPSQAPCGVIFLFFLKPIFPHFFSLYILIRGIDKSKRKPPSIVFIHEGQLPFPYRSTIFRSQAPISKTSPSATAAFPNNSSPAVP